jgi:hypothetical protein
MSYISPKLIAKIYHALGQNKGTQAVCLLRQHQFWQNPQQDRQLMTEIVRLAESSWVDGEYERAADHFNLGLALYESCFQDNHVDALRCVSGLLSMAEETGDALEIIRLCDKVHSISRQVREGYCKPKAVAV